ncbi:hypothetical protein VTO73DRAFT_13635 [Trametes versicolor]
MSEQSQKPRHDMNKIRPVTFRQVVNATRAHADAPFHIGNELVLGVVTIAQVVRVRRYDTATLLDLEDGTTGGRIFAKRWLNGQDSDGLPDEEQYYARIVGTIVRGHESKNTLRVEGIQRVTDPHQLFLHILEAAFVSLTLERGPPPLSVRRSVGPRFLSGEQEVPAQFALPSAPTTPAVTRVARPSHALQSTPTRQVVTSSPAIPPRPPTPPPPAVRPHTPPPPVVHPPTPPRSPSPQYATPPSSPSPPRAQSPPTSPSPAPARASSSAIQQSSESRRVSGIKRDPWAHLSALERAILLQIFNAPSDEDVSVRAITRGVSHYEVTQADISHALDALTDKGFVEPLDNEHYIIKTNHYPTSS